MMTEKPYKLILGDALEQVKRLDSESVDCVISSPPYYQLRDYGFEGQLGLEKTFQEYLEKLWALMDEVRRVIKPTGTAWINLGDTYSGSGNGKGDTRAVRGINTHYEEKYSGHRSGKTELPNKSLLLIPHRFAIGCSERNWLIRNDIIWAKRNGMPESVTDRFSKKHEYFFLMAKQTKYYFDLDSIRDAHKCTVETYKSAANSNLQVKNDAFVKQTGDKHRGFKNEQNPNGKNPGSVSDFWDIPTRPSSAKHYATFNTELIDKPIKAGCPIGGTILDMFCGTATTGIRALQLDRKFIGFDGNADYLAIAEARIEAALNKEPLFGAA